jgi:prepilin-type N-terminal cleavage/methylation domain-containing protein
MGVFKKEKYNKAFTLIEMLLVIALIAILAGIVIVAINPGRQLANARNAERASELKALNDAIYQYYADNLAWPTTTMPTTLTEVCSETNSNPAGCLDLSNLTPDYLTAIPDDPTATSGTDYFVALPSSNLPALVANNSTEYSQDLIAIGTSTAATESAGGNCDASCLTALRTSLVAYYSFDVDNGSSVTDDSDNSNTGTGSGASYTGSGHVGTGGFSFDGANDYVSVSDDNTLDLTTGITLQAWVEKDSTKPNAIVSKGNYSLKIGSDNRPIFEIVEGGDTITNHGYIEDSDHWAYSFEVFEGDLYASGTYYNGGYLDLVIWKYNKGTNTWEDVGGPIAGTSGAGLVVYDGELYSGNNNTAFLYRYDGGDNLDPYE